MFATISRGVGARLARAHRTFPVSRPGLETGIFLPPFFCLPALVGPRTRTLTEKRGQKNSQAEADWESVNMQEADLVPAVFWQNGEDLSSGSYHSLAPIPLPNPNPRQKGKGMGAEE